MHVHFFKKYVFNQNANWTFQWKWQTSLWWLTENFDNHLVHLNWMYITIQIKEIWCNFGFFATLKSAWKWNSLLFSKCILIILFLTLHVCICCIFIYFIYLVIFYLFLLLSFLTKTSVFNEMADFSVVTYARLFLSFYLDINYNKKKWSVAVSITSWL